MPDFKVSDPSGKTYMGNELLGEKGLLIVFTCNHCPYAMAVWPRLIKLAKYAKTLRINNFNLGILCSIIKGCIKSIIDIACYHADADLVLFKIKFFSYI